MADIDAVFDELRREVTGTVAGPEAPEIVRRARRRSRVRAVAASVVVLLAVGGGALAMAAGPRPQRQTIAPVRLSPSPAARRALAVTDLLYGPTALKDRRHWFVGADSGLKVPECHGEAWNSDERDDPEGMVFRQDVDYDANPNRDIERTMSKRGEDVFGFVDVTAARRITSRIVANAQGCGKGFTIRRPAIGDEAVAISSVSGSGSDRQTAHAVVVRKGTVIAVYWDLRNDAPPLTTMARHEQDARAMVARLCGLGFGC